MSQQCVLVAEDELIIGVDLCDTVEEAGYEVAGPYDTASSAIDSLERRRPDLAILDVRLDVEEAAIRVHWVGGERRYPLVAGPVSLATPRGVQRRTHRGRITFLHYAQSPEHQIFADELASYGPEVRVVARTPALSAASAMAFASA